MSQKVQVDSEKLRSAAQRLSQLAPSADSIPNDVEQAVSDAKNANDGFLTVDVCESFAERTSGTSLTIGEHVGAMVSPIEASAQAWDDADGENASDIKKQGADLGKAKV